MRPFNLNLAVLALACTANCVPAETANSRLMVSTDFDLPPGSVQVVEGVWYSNTTMAAWKNTSLTKGLSPSVSTCGDSTFENRASTASPLVKDCLHLHDNIVGDGTWTVGRASQHQLAQYGTCAFGVDAHSGIASKGSFYVGNEDIRDLIVDSIARFQWDDNGEKKVGTRGFMPCQPNGVSVEWGIYHD